jgi:hypothetical protein
MDSNPDIYIKNGIILCPLCADYLPLVLFEVRSIDVDKKPFSLHQHRQQL